MDVDRIAKQKLNVMLIVDASTSMRGTRIEQVNKAIKDIKDYLTILGKESSNVDFYLSVLTFSTDSSWVNNKKEEFVEEFKFSDIKAGGRSNLHLAYKELNNVLNKVSQGGIMPDFGGAAPIILLLSDGHPTENCKRELEELKKKPWFNVALRYGIAIELNDDKTQRILKDFVGDNGEVINCINSNILKNIIKIIVLTASKVKSKSSSFSTNGGLNGQIINQNQLVKNEIKEALDDVERWEW